MSPCIAVDLGVSTVRVAVRRGSRIVVLPGSGGERFTRADVILDDAPLVGEAARRSAALAPGRVVENVLRQLESAASDDARVALAQLLRSVVTSATRTLDESADEVVVAVPASFDPAMRAEVGNAVRDAGLRLRGLVTDAVAAARAYVHVDPRHCTLLVVDIGAGTSHATIIDADRDVIDVRATAGDAHLGGADIDDRIAGLLGDRVQTAIGIDPRANEAGRATLHRLGEQCKMALTRSQSAAVNVPVAGDGAIRMVHILLTRDELVRELADLVGRWRALVAQALASARAGRDDIDDVLLLGVSAELAGLADIWREQFASGEQTLEVQSPETVVAGAAVEAAARAGHGHPTVILDVAPAAISVRTPTDDVRAVVAHGASLPARRHMRISIRDAAAWRADFLAHVPNRGRATAPKVVARFRLAEPASVPAEIVMAIDVDADGMLVVVATDSDANPVALDRTDRPDPRDEEE